jgi:hypothetical protein
MTFWDFANEHSAAVTVIAFFAMFFTYQTIITLARYAAMSACADDSEDEDDEEWEDEEPEDEPENEPERDES